MNSSLTPPSLEEAFRSSLDDAGILMPGKFEIPERESAYTVFAQRPDARVEVAIWERHAAQYFSTRLGLTVSKRYDLLGAFPLEDAARVVLAPPNAPGEIRLCYGRPRTADDLAAAERADMAAGSPGLFGLARRCATVWLVAAESPDDRSALLLAAILATVVLGPILTPSQLEIFGVRTARRKLEGGTALYR